MKTWPIDPLGLRNIQLEVSEKFPQGELACGSQALIATLLFDPSMSALPRQPLQGLMIIWGGGHGMCRWWKAGQSRCLCSVFWKCWKADVRW